MLKRQKSPIREKDKREIESEASLFFCLRFRSSIAPPSPSIYLSRAIAPRQFTPSFRTVESGLDGKKRLRDFFRAEAASNLSHTFFLFLSRSLARSLDPLSLFRRLLSHSQFSPFRMESSPLPLIERAKSCGFSTRWTLQMASS